MTKAAAEVAKLSSTSNHEHGVFVDLLDDKIYTYVEGTDSTVAPRYDEVQGKKVAFIHSHLRATPTSAPDIDIIVNNDEVDIVAAVRIDGVISIVQSNGVKMHDDIPSWEAASVYAQELNKLGDEDEEDIDIRLQMEKLIKPYILEKYTKGEVITRG